MSKGSAPVTVPSAARALQNEYVSVAKAILPSVVEITTAQGLGSGIVYDPKGDIVTNDHVVGSAKKFQVRLSSGGGALSAKLVGTYPPDDLAVIRVTGTKPLKPARFGDSAKLQVGDIVLAVGNPLGLQSSVTQGIVSALGRTLTEPQSPDSPGATLPDVVQTSAAINPGNSGGALVDLQRQVIGIPTLAATSPQQGGAAPGLGFAIPSNIVTDIAGQLIAHGHVVHSHRAALGVVVSAAYDSRTSQPAGAAIVSVVKNGPAARAGLEPGEVIIGIDGTPVTSPEDLSGVLARMSPGQKASVHLVRNNRTRATVTVTLGQLPGTAG